MPGHEQETDLRDSTPGSTGPEGAAGGMGVSSERVGQTGPGQVRTDGLLDVSEEAAAGDAADVPPEQSPGGEEVHPDPPVPPVSGYNSHDPRSADHPFDTSGPRSDGGA